VRRRRKFKLFINNNELLAWDPFCRNEEKTKTLQTITLSAQQDGIKGEIEIHPFILPSQNDFSSRNAFEKAAGPGNWNQQQGLYIYRAGRMIQSGGWSRLRTVDEHMKLARIAVYFSPPLDALFKVNVAKMRVELPTDFQDAIRDAIAPAIKLARETYDKKQPKPLPVANNAGLPKGPASKMSADVPTTTPIADTAFEARAEKSTASILKLTAEDWASRMMAVATETERSVISSVLSRMTSH
jgi:hypothetical protein